MGNSQKVVLITGGGSGLGRGMAESLVEAGMRVCVTVRDAEGSSAPKDTTSYVADMRDHSGLADLVDAVVQDHGRLDAVVCNAAIQGFAPAAEITPSYWQEVIDTNLTAPFLLAQAAAPHLKQQSGLIVFLSSVHGVLAAPGRTAYAVTKAGLIAMARNLAADLSADQVRAVSLVLGPFASPALAQGVSRFFPDLGPDKALERFASMQPLGRVGQASELAGLIAFLMSDAARFISGTSITVDGGQSSRLSVPQLGGQD